MEKQKNGIFFGLKTKLIIAKIEPTMHLLFRKFNKVQEVFIKEQTQK